jgi:mannose-1-phosphate guanylyltransferase
MLVMPADHYIARPDAFAATVRQACDWAAAHDDLVTLGVLPARPETGYGYLKLDARRGGAGSAAEPSTAKQALPAEPSTAKQALPAEPSKVERFVEKPDLARAEEFVRSGEYLWNGGMFIWRASTILRAFDQHMPELKRVWDAAGGRVESAYPGLTATSIDFGVMEKATNVVTFPLDCGWDDLGSWTSLESLADILQARHAAGVVSAGEVIAIESAGNIVDVPRRLVSLLGVDDLIVVEHGDALLIARKERAQDIKRVVEAVRKARPELA